jgi:hypothetical protein
MPLNQWENKSDYFADKEEKEISGESLLAWTAGFFEKNTISSVSMRYLLYRFDRANSE